jgi:hypothetical protein
MLTRRGATVDSRHREPAFAVVAGACARSRGNAPSSHGGTTLALPVRMPIATRTSTQTNDSHDAPRAARTARDEVPAREPLPTLPDPAEACEPDPYDNVACTD